MILLITWRCQQSHNQADGLIHIQSSTVSHFLLLSVLDPDNELLGADEGAEGPDLVVQAPSHDEEDGVIDQKM